MLGLRIHRSSKCGWGAALLMLLCAGCSSDDASAEGPTEAGATDGSGHDADGDDGALEAPTDTDGGDEAATDGAPMTDGTAASDGATTGDGTTAEGAVAAGDGPTLDDATVVGEATAPGDASDGAAPDAALCTEGEYRCNGDALLRCGVHATFEPVAQCPSGLCDAVHRRCSECSDDTQCPALASLSECQRTGCVAGTCSAKPKAAGQACSLGSCDGAGTCLCPAGAYRCTGAALETCSADRESYRTIDTCGSDLLCDAARAHCNVCQPGTTSCVDSHTARSCSDDGLHATDTVDPTRTCTGNGQWVEVCATSAECTPPADPCLEKGCDLADGVCKTTARDANSVCAGNGACDGAGTCVGPTGRSCEAATPACANGASCCRATLVPGGTFPMGRGSSTSSDPCPAKVSCIDITDRPEHPATVSSFYLDTFEVTVGRFRNFVAAFDTAPPIPANDAGAHPKLPGSGWRNPGWNSNLPSSASDLVAHLTACSPHFTWAAAASAESEPLPINCVNWYEALAFCIWDGGRLPTDAEWEYAAAGGDQNRLFPWTTSSDKSAPDVDHGSFQLGTPAIVPVGSFPLGAGRYGQLDLAGNLEEWTLDWFSSTFYGTVDAPATCDDCANFEGNATYRDLRGGAWAHATVNGADLLYRAAARSGTQPVRRDSNVGFRCARDATP